MVTANLRSPTLNRYDYLALLVFVVDQRWHNQVGLLVVSFPGKIVIWKLVLRNEAFRSDPDHLLRIISKVHSVLNNEDLLEY